MELEENQPEKKGLTVKQPIALTTSKHNFSMSQMRILVKIVEALQSKMHMGSSSVVELDEDISFTIPTGRNSALIKSDNFSDVRMALKKMMKEIVTLKNCENGVCVEVGFPLIKKYKYSSSLGEIQILMDKDLFPHLTNLEKGYTKYSAPIALKASTPNTMKLYMYFSHYKDLNTINLTLDNLREWLQLGSKYKYPNDIERRILNPAQQELSKNADVSFSILKKHKKGKKVTGWQFKIIKRSIREVKNNVSSNEAKKIWTTCLEVIKKKVEEKIFETWFKPIEVHEYKNKNLVLEVPSDYFRKAFDDNSAGILYTVLRDLVGEDVKFSYKVNQKKITKDEDKLETEDQKLFKKLVTEFELRADQANRITQFVQKNRAQEKKIKIALKEIATAKSNNKIHSVGAYTVARLAREFNVEDLEKVPK